MRIVANGKTVDLPDGATVRDLVDSLGLPARSVVVERNGEAVPRARFPHQALVDGDRLEVVRPVQGGDALDRRDVLERSRLYFVAPGSISDDVIASVLREGVDLLQLRDKEATDLAVLAAGRRFKQLAACAGAPFVVNDRADLAFALGSDGVHLGQDDLPASHARGLLGSHALIGRSTHTREQIQAATDDHAAGDIDYIAVGPVHATPTKLGREPVGYELVSYAAAHVSFPWFAIGGIDASNVHEVIDSGARRIVVVRAITDARDPAGVTRALCDALSLAKR